ncbi:MAG: primosomal protein N' (replication factor Y) (superfamily II helicase) [Nitrospirae bacterium]|nr:MAG: primosomal protein N' (replication factor Y) (superfamily II helicase) [Nitrospirota bacterium]
MLMRMPMFADVIFPQKLPPLTYRVNDDAPENLSGRIVQAGLGRRVTSGVVVAVYKHHKDMERAHREMPDESRLKAIETAGGYFWSPAGMKLVQWLADYYLVPAGLALKSCFFEDAVAKAGVLRKTRKPLPAAAEPEMLLLGGDELASIQRVLDTVRGNAYRTYLYHAPVALGTHAFIQELLRNSVSTMTGILLIVPEFHFLERYAPLLRMLVPERSVVLHSKMTPNQRIRAVHRIRSGEADIVLGTRSAVLAPLPKTSIIIVDDEHNSAYKAEEGLHYHGRDVAVMRGYLEKSCVVLASSCPSVESAYNVQIGKYHPLDHQKTKRGTERRPEIRIVPPPPRKGHTQKQLAHEVVRTVRGYLKTHERVLFLINRKGYSLLQCRDCGELIRCNTCSNALVFHKSANRLDCRLCMAKSELPEQCPSCAGVSLHPVGAGTERIRDEIAEVLGQDAVIMEKNGGDSGENILFAELAPLVVGTEYAVRSGTQHGYAAAIVLSIDATLSQPDFRAHERTFQDVVQVLHCVKPGGTLFIQTRNSREPLIRCIGRLDYNGFLSHELQQRRLLHYPPFSRLLRLSVHYANDERITKQLDTFLGEQRKDTSQILGPLELPSGLKGFRRCWQILIKTSDRKTSGDLARSVQKMFERERRVRVVADADPYRM